MEFSEEVKRYIRGTEFMPIATCGEAGVHLVATWGGEDKDGYIRILGEDTIVWPAGHYSRTEANLKKTNRIQTLVVLKGERNGYRLEGTAQFVSEGEVYRKIKERFKWARAALVMKVDKFEKLL